MNKEKQLVIELLVEKLSKLTKKKVKLGQIDIKLLNTISTEVTNEYPEINRGGCAQFAIILGELFSFNKFVFLYQTKVDVDFGLPVHVVIRLANGKFYDAEGFQSLSTLELNFGNGDDNLILEDVGLDDVKIYREEIKEPYDYNKLKQFIINIINPLV